MSGREIIAILMSLNSIITRFISKDGFTLIIGSFLSFSSLLKPLSRTIRATERVITVLMRSQRETRSLGYPKRFVRCIGSNSIDKNEYLIQHKIRFKTKMNIFDHLMTFKTLALL